MRRRHRRKNNQRKIIIFSLIGLLFIMVAGYSAFQTNLNINVKGNIKFISTIDLTKSVVTEGDGLYVSTYEEGRYIYRGANPDNYITFNNELWRIMSVEADGTLKIRRDEILTDLQWDAVGNRDSSTSTYCTRASSDGCNAWSTTASMVGSPSNFIQYYPNGNTSDSANYSGTVTQDSTMNTYLNSEYYNTLSDVAKSYVVDGIFNISSPGYFKSTENISYDVQQVKQYQWKGKVALMTITEWMQATSNTMCTSLNIASTGINGEYVCQQNNWMYTNQVEWTISPYVYESRRALWITGISTLPDEYAASAYRKFYARPVLYLSSDIKLSGSGKETDSYTINS